MIRKYPWHFVYLIFVVICLSNIFQKLQWSSPTDQILWQETDQGLLCRDAPDSGNILPGDILLTVNKFVIHDRIDLYRVIEHRHYCRYEIEREGLLKIVGIDILRTYTPFTYYILVFSGLIFILLTLNLLNAQLVHLKEASAPPIFFLVSLSFSGLLIFSPTGTFHILDFVFLLLDRLSMLLFPAFLLHFALLYPARIWTYRRFGKRILLALYTVPSAILGLYLLFMIRNLSLPTPGVLSGIISYFRGVTHIYLVVYLLISLALLARSSLILATRRRQRRFLISLGMTSIGLLPLMLSPLFPSATHREPSILAVFLLFMTALAPVGLVVNLSKRRFTDIQTIIRKTLSVSSVFLFIFGIFFFLGINIEQNKFMGIFWSIAAILTAGYLFKPIEATVQGYFERIFYKRAYTFKRKLRDLIQSLQGERNLSELSRNFLETINSGFSLRNSSMLIYSRKNIFYSLPGQSKLLLSKTIRDELFRRDHLVVTSTQEYSSRFPKDAKTLKPMGYYQFLPLKTADKLTGVVAIGLKEDGTYLSIEDWELLLNIAQSLSLSVENAFLYSELKTQLEEINWLKEFNETIIENLNFGIVVLSKLNIVLSWNQFMEEKFSISRRDAMNRKAYRVLGNSLWKQILPRKSSRISTFQTRIPLGGEDMMFDISISPLRDNAGKITGTILLFEDVTEKIRMMNQLITTEKMASIGMLSAGIAHEVNTPLTGISSYCQLILDNPDDPENMSFLVRIQEQIQRANKIIRSLLDFSRQQGEVPLEIDLDRVIQESLSLMEHKLKKKNVRIERDIQLTRKFYGFQTRLQQLFINLLINATDAVDSSRGCIRLTGSNDDERITITVSDNGHGISDRNIANIFDPFFTTKGPGEGTGLGLSIAYNIVREHFGEMKVSSVKDEGTTFTIIFPIQNPLRRITL